MWDVLSRLEAWPECLRFRSDLDFMLVNTSFARKAKGQGWPNELCLQLRLLFNVMSKGSSRERGGGVVIGQTVTSGQLRIVAKARRRDTAT